MLIAHIDATPLYPLSDVAFSTHIMDMDLPL
jgi:hypothetical protein